MKETFRKLLRPGVDYQDTFQAFCEKKWSRRGRTSSSSSRLEATSKEAFASKMALTKKEMESLLRQLGIVMNDNELRLLIDAFDTDGDGVITMAEFLGMHVLHISILSYLLPQYYRFCRAQKRQESRRVQGYESVVFIQYDL